MSEEAQRRVSVPSDIVQSTCFLMTPRHKTRYQNKYYCHDQKFISLLHIMKLTVTIVLIYVKNLIRNLIWIVFVEDKEFFKFSSLPC